MFYLTRTWTDCYGLRHGFYLTRTWTDCYGLRHGFYLTRTWTDCYGLRHGFEGLKKIKTLIINGLIFYEANRWNFDGKILLVKSSKLNLNNDYTLFFNPEVP